MEKVMMKSRVLKFFVVLSGIALSIHAHNVNRMLERVHQRLDKALENAPSISARDLLNKGTLKASLAQGPLTLDIQEVNGVKLIKGLKREINLIDKLFWCKQEELVQQLQTNSEHGYTVFADLLAKRCMYNTSPLLMFMREIVLEDEALDRCLHDARDNQAEQLKKMRETFNALLECLSKVFGVNS